MAKITQEIETAISQPSTTWRTDVNLEQPILLGPKDGTNLCSPNTELISFLADGSTGIILRWAAVPGASFYVVQWCVNSSFHGPTAKAAKTSSLSHTLKFLQDIRVCEEYHWRVMAFNLSGGVSVKSETWTIDFDCDDLPSNAENFEVGCQAFNVDINIQGYEVLKPDTQSLQSLIVSWDKEDRRGNTVDMVSVDWSIKQSKRSPVSIVCETSDYIVLDVGSLDPDESECFTVVAEIVFQWNSSDGPTFTCTKSKDICIDAIPDSRQFIRHAKISKQLGCNRYEIQFVDRIFDAGPVSTSEEAPPESPPGVCESEVDPGCTPPEYCMDWYESIEDFPEYAVAADIRCRVLPDLKTQMAIGTDLVVAKIQGPDLDDISSGYIGSSEAACDFGSINNYWWILEADTDCEDRPCLDMVTDVKCATDCDGNPIIEVCTTRVMFVPGTVVCDELCPEQSCSSSSP